LLPNGGLGGFIVEKEGRVIAAAFVYFTNSALGYIDYMVSDPNYKGKDIYEMIVKLIDACSDYAVKSGCRLVWAMTTYKGVIKRCEDLKYNVLDYKHTVIYTHDKSEKRLNK
jgi:hypothetical protein